MILIIVLASIIFPSNKPEIISVFCSPVFSGFYFLLKLHKSLDKGFGPGRASWNVDVDREDFINVLDSAVGLIKWPAAD
jgi:hypothetical protein